MEILDPTSGDDANEFSAADRLDTMDAGVVGIISNGKQGTGPFFAALRRELIERHGAAEVVQVTKSNYSAPAEAEILDQARQWTALVAGVGD